MLFIVLTGISVVEVIFDIAGDVLMQFGLCPMCVWLIIIPDENSKQHNHGNLPDEADSRQTNTNIGVLLPAEKIAHALTTIPHGDAADDDDAPITPQQGPRSDFQQLLSRYLYGHLEGCDPILHSQTGGGHTLCCRLA